MNRSISKLIETAKFSSDKNQRIEAIWLIEKKGQKAICALPTLVDILQDSLKPDSDGVYIVKSGEIKSVEMRHEYTDQEVLVLKSFATGDQLKPVRLKNHSIIIACLAALKAIGKEASIAKSTIEYAIEVGKNGDKLVNMLAQDTLKEISKTK